MVLLVKNNVMNSWKAFSRSSLSFSSFGSTCSYSSLSWSSSSSQSHFLRFGSQLSSYFSTSKSTSFVFLKVLWNSFTTPENNPENYKKWRSQRDDQKWHFQALKRPFSPNRIIAQNEAKTSPKAKLPKSACTRWGRLFLLKSLFRLFL